MSKEPTLPPGVPERVVCAEADSREDWLRHRRSFVTGSEIATLFDEHAYTKWATVLAEKTSGVSDFDATQDHVVQGSCAEPFLSSYLEAARGIKTVPCGQLIRDSAEPRLAATPDYLAVPQELTNGEFWNVQFKFSQAKRGQEGPVGRAKKVSEWGPNIPAYVAWQVCAEMAVLGVSKSLVACYHRWTIPKFGRPGDQLGVYVVDRDEELIGRIRAAVAALPVWVPA